jgi:hypothetical protein
VSVFGPVGFAGLVFAMEFVGRPAPILGIGAGAAFAISNGFASADAHG